MKYILFFLVTTLLSFSARAQDPDLQEAIPTIEDMHFLLENAARSGNAQLSNTRVDDYTILKLFTYDKTAPQLTYHYSTNVLEAFGPSGISDAGKKAMYDYHKVKTCGTMFKPFMIAFGLLVSHRFEDVATGLEVIRITVSAKDCSSI
jgi:hypothetical protein